MKLKYLITILVLPLVLFCQNNTNSLIDNFDADSRWETFEDEEGTGSIENGMYTLISHLDDGFPHSVEDPYIDWTKDFSIEMAYQQKSFSFQNISGLIWAKEKNTFNGFFLRTSGFYEIITIDENNVHKKIKDWTKSDAVKTANHTNKLRVDKKGGEYWFYINDKLVHKAASNLFYAERNYMGFIVESKNEIEVDYFKFLQDVKINVASDAHIPKKRKNLGLNVNTRGTEINPIVSADGKTLYYVMDENHANVGGIGQDAWVSTRITDSTWGKGTNLGAPINNIGNNGVISVSPDNNTIYVTGVYSKKGEAKKGVGFSYSKKTTNGWAIPKPINIKDFYNISEFQEACFAPNNKTMIFTAQRKDSYGGNDLYVSFMIDKEHWSAPLNMGRVLNTKLDEVSPFIAADGKTLYFSSQGRAGYGDEDIFVSKRLDESWTNWSEPMNLGPSINSPGFDAYFTVSAKGDKAFYSTDLDSYGAEDILQVELSNETKPEPVVIIKGRVLDAKTKQPLGADMTYEELPKGTDLGDASSDPKTGEYKIVLPYGKAYGVFVEKEGYLSQNENFDFTQVTEYDEIERDILLTKVEVGEKMVMNNIFFEQGTPNILPNSYPELDRLVETLKKSPKMEIEVSGHTDNVGNHGLNLALSEKRAEVIVKYLTDKGIKPARLSNKGYGDTQPIASNQKEETRKLNRRVEIKILKK